MEEYSTIMEFTIQNGINNVSSGNNALEGKRGSVPYFFYDTIEQKQYEVHNHTVEIPEHVSRDSYVSQCL